MIRAAIAATALLGFAGLITAAPAFADTPFDITCGDGSHGPCYTTDGPVYTDTIHNYLVFGPKTANSYAHLPSDTVNGYQNAIRETIKQYTGVDIGAPASAPSGSPSP